MLDVSLPCKYELEELTRLKRLFGLIPKDWRRSSSPTSSATLGPRGIDLPPASNVVAASLRSAATTLEHVITLPPPPFEQHTRGKKVRTNHDSTYTTTPRTRNFNPRHRQAIQRSARLHNVSFDVQPGELHAVMGENGAGKSTLMKILSGVYSEYDGELALHGHPVRFQSTRDAEDAGVSIIHQELNLVEQLSVAANIFLGREEKLPLGILNQSAMNRRAGELLRQLESNISPRALVSSLRIGDQQLVEIAKAISLNAEILIMDEPTSALTESEVARLYGVIDQLRKRGVTILYISHKMDEVFGLQIESRFCATVSSCKRSIEPTRRPALSLT